jgi:amidophosphoribosyltransferase
MFEYVYFSRPDSVAQGKLIYNVRKELGRRLAKTAPVKADIVVAVPDTSRPAAEGYSQASGIPMEEGLMKNRYVGRTFIMASQSKRLAAVKLKLNAVRPLVEGKRIVLIDDSIVRGTTSGPILKLLRTAGAKEIHLRIACPPVIAPCFYGVDLPTYEELAAAKKSVEEIRKMVGADSLAYVSVDDLVASIGLKKSDLCLGCVSGDYPTKWGNEIAALLKKHGSDPNVRVWEQAHPGKGLRGGSC